MSWAGEPSLPPGIPPGGLEIEEIVDQIAALSNAVTATIATSQTTASTSYVDLATVGPAQTVTVRPSGLVKVTLTGNLSNSGANYSVMGVTLSGANVVAAVDTTSLQHFSTAPHRGSYTALITGLTAGVTTFTAQYRVTGGTGTFVDRNIIVETL